MSDPEFEDAEQSYRRGYIQGAWAMFEATRDFLPEEYSQMLFAFLGGPLADWRLSAQRHESKRRNDLVTRDIIPPRVPFRLMTPPTDTPH
jgi:hypothetical protein